MSTENVVQTQTRSHWKRWLFRLIMFLMVYGTIEVISVATLAMLQVDGSVSLMRSWQKDTASGQNVSDGEFRRFIPTLVGFTILKTPGWKRSEVRRRRFNHLGFRDDGESLYRRADDVFIVGIAGGSVAFQFSWSAEQLLKQRLADHPRVQGRRIQFVRLALSGYKQPQQLMAYSYLTSNRKN